jgi:hypothetical protein
MEKQRSDFISTRKQPHYRQENVTWVMLIKHCWKLQRNAGFPINGPILKVQAEKFVKQLGHENFTCNTGWLDRFKNRHKHCFSKVSGEVLSVDSKTASEWVTSVWVECQQGYCEENIYTAD